jgi:hypothetical protein
MRQPWIQSVYASWSRVRDGCLFEVVQQRHQRFAPVVLQRSEPGVAVTGHCGACDRTDLADVDLALAMLHELFEDG